MISTGNARGYFYSLCAYRIDMNKQNVIRINLANELIESCTFSSFYTLSSERDEEMTIARQDEAIEMR